MKHLGIGESRANLSRFGADPESLRPLVRMDAAAQADTANLAAIPAAIRSDMLAVAVEVQIAHQQSFNAGILVILRDLLLQDRRAALV